MIRQVADQTWEGAIRLAKLWEANPRSRKAGVSEPDPAPLAPRESGQSSRCDEACHPRGSNERQPWGFPPAGADPWSLGSALSRRDLREFTAHSSRLVERHAAGEFTLDKALPQESPDREQRFRKPRNVGVRLVIGGCFAGFGGVAGGFGMKYRS